jgi:tetratricopeptide (TPR) repeat protein
MRRDRFSWARRSIGRTTFTRVGHPVRSRLVLATLMLALSRERTAAAQTRPSDAQPRKTTPAVSAGVERRLTDAVRRDPDSFEAHHALAVFYLQERRLDAAIPHLERAQAIDPAHYATGYDLALALVETGNLDRAREQVRRMLAVKPAGELHNLLGNVEERAGNLVGAAEEYQRAAHMDPTEQHLFDWGNNLVQLRAFEPAAEVFGAAIARHPESARLHVGLGIVHYSRGQYEAAVKSFCRAADLAPSDPRAYQFLGEMYGVAPELGREVTERLARFVKVQPRNALAHLHYALSLWKGDPAASAPADLRQVETLLRRAVALDPRLAKGFLELGILLLEQQRDHEAIQELRRAIQLEPGLAQGHYRLAHAYRRTGQNAMAAKELEIFQRLKTESR